MLFRSGLLMSRSWVVMFDDEGLDAVIPWTDLEEENIISKLSGEQPAFNQQHIIARTIMRARLNGHRNPEIWGFNTAEDMTAEAMIKLWKTAEDITALKDLVRSRGDQLY